MKRLFIFVCILFPLSVSATDNICPAGYHPVEYVELEYIRSSGTQYINTDYLFESTLEYEIKLTIEPQTSGIHSYYGCYEGAWSSSNPSVPNVSTYSGYKIPKNFRGGGGNTVSIGVAERQTGTISLTTDRISWSEGGSAVFDRNSMPTFTTNVPFLLFASYYGGGAKEHSVFSLYHCILKSHGVVVRDFIPVRRLSDGAVGMFNTIDGKFYGNDGSGEFIAGPEKTDKKYITDENGDTVCEMCPANTYKPNAGNEQCTECPENTFSPVGSTQLSDCAKILRVKDYVVYMPLGKRTEHGLCVMSDGKKYCADVYERQ